MSCARIKFKTIHINRYLKYKAKRKQLYIKIQIYNYIGTRNAIHNDSNENKCNIF